MDRRTRHQHTASSRPTRRAWLRMVIGSGAATSLGATAWVHAQSRYPSRPVHLVVPFSPGGATDVLGRLLAQSMQAQLGQSVVVENRVGAAGVIAASYVAKAPADGSVMLFGGVGTNALLAYTQPSLPYNPERDFIGAGNFCFVDFVMAVAGEGRYRSLDDLLKDARQRPGQVSYMSAGPLGTLHVAQEYLWKRANVSLNHIPYKGESHVVPDLVAGRVDLALMTLSLTRQLAHEGKVRMLATLAPKRLHGAPELPTVAEQGFPGFAMPTWNGIFLPRGTPDDVVQALNRALNGALRDPEVTRKITAMGVSPAEPNSPEQHAQFMHGERQRWRTMVSQSGLSVQ